MITSNILKEEEMIDLMSIHAESDQLHIHRISILWNTVPNTLIVISVLFSESPITSQESQ